MTVARIFDFETNGTEANSDPLQLAYVDVSLEHKTFFNLNEMLFNTSQPIDVEARAVHHLNPNQLKSYPTYASQREELEPKFNSGVDFFVAHNLAFDSQFIQIDHPAICTFKCARHLWPDAPKHSNQVLRYWHDLKVTGLEDRHPHDAVYDIMTTAALFLRMFEEGNTPEQLVELTNKPVLLREVGFGKWKGTLWENVPVDYLHWILKNDFDEDTLHTARHWIASRGQQQGRW